MANDTVRGGFSPQRSDEPPTLRIGTWNMSHWTAPKISLVASHLAIDILAIQETHLAPIPLSTAHRTATNAGLRLHHGGPVKPMPHSEHGRSCGVGFLTRIGVPVLPALPCCPAWRRLAAMRRLHGVRLAPRVGLPHGLLLLSIYAPLHTQAAERSTFDGAFLDLVHSLDMQQPTLLLGDFNGSACPARDYGSQRSHQLPIDTLLAQLLGPGAPWIDVHLSLLPSPPMTYHNAHRDGSELVSRIDLILANTAAMALVSLAAALEDVRDGGHSPVLVELALASGDINWRPPRPRPPPLLRLTSSELRRSKEWETLLQAWASDPIVQHTLDPAQPHTLDSLSCGLRRSLETLVSLAGGWTTRSSTRRLAYDSTAIRHVRRRLAHIHHLAGLCRRDATSQPGSWPSTWLRILDSLQALNVPLPRSTVPALLEALASAKLHWRRELDALLRRMRQERSVRWRAVLPTLWRERPAVLHHWLDAEGVPWGTRPVQDSNGLQCMSPATVDAAVRAFWVDAVLRQHAACDEDHCWATFLSSPFGRHLPQASWPSTPWSAERVQSALQSMREHAAPGMAGIPIAVWRSLPMSWAAAVARLLELIELEGRWPSAWLDAYVTMVPKPSGGSRPQDQRPITVLEVLYRLWAKGVVQDWRDVLQHQLLGSAAFGFRAGSGPLHAAQVIDDLILNSRAQHTELWLASFDVQKCFDSLPWWAVFRSLLAVGVSPAIVRCFSSFYQHVRRRFRYGAVDGDIWHAANGLAQGCPASPDLLNILLETFHRWAAAQDLGASVAGLRIASLSFADDVVLIATSPTDMQRLISAYLDWCSLLGVLVTKTQLWSSLGPGQQLRIRDTHITSSPSFKFVGIVLGLLEPAAAKAHLRPRLAKALVTAQRLRSLQLPASLCSLLWRTTVLPQALYGCQLRDIPPPELDPLAKAGKALLQHKAPLDLANWRANEIIMGLPLGETVIADPVTVMRSHQLVWLQLLSNFTGISGIIHRAIACPAVDWNEPSPALRAALLSVDWRIQRNVSSTSAASWPRLQPEPSFPGDLLLIPVDEFPAPDTVHTDGSVSTSGGAAVWDPDTETALACFVPSPFSSTHCELVALLLAMRLHPAQILTDSLSSLQLLRSWHRRSTASVLQCPLRSLVRQLIAAARTSPAPPALVKVKAHDAAALDLQHPRALGNDRADHWAKQAATGTATETWTTSPHSFGDAVELLDHTGQPISDVQSVFPTVWWQRCRRAWASKGPRPRLDVLFPLDTTFDWLASNVIFRRAVATVDHFAHPVPPAVVKWVARIRCGCLATSRRLHLHGMGPTSTACVCCGAPLDDEVHVLSGCPATGSADSSATFIELWSAASDHCNIRVPPPPPDWIAAHRLPLAAALIPDNILWHHPLPPPTAQRFLHRLHTLLAQRSAEWLRRREELRATAASTVLDTADDPAVDTGWTRGHRRPSSLPVERQLSVQALRQAEIDRCSSSSSSPSSAPAPTPAPSCGPTRLRFLRQLLLTVLQDQTTACPAATGSTAELLVALFEQSTGHAFTSSPGASLSQRIIAMGRTLGYFIDDPTRAPLNPPLQRTSRSGTFFYNRAPLKPLDVAAWRRSLAGPSERTPALHVRMADATIGLTTWIRDHPHLRAAPIDHGESGMALLFLWEVDHGCPFPSAAGDNLPCLLSGFNKRLKAQVASDPLLREWLTSKQMSCPITPGAPPSHHARWSISIHPPPEGLQAPWYNDFTTRWQRYLLSLRRPTSSPSPASAASSSTDQLNAPQRGRTTSLSDPPSKRQRTAPPARPVPTTPLSPPTSAAQPRPASAAFPMDEPARKRQTPITNWLQHRSGLPHQHGRAAEGPPT